MESPLLLVTVGLLLTISVLFALVAILAGRREYSPDTRAAGVAFTLAWASLAAKALFDASRTLAPALPVDDLLVWLTATRLLIIATAIMIWGFGYYVGFLWSGRARFSIPLGAFAAFHALFFLYFIERTQHLAVITGTWSVRIQAYELTIPEYMPILILVLFFVPILAIAGAYLTLSLRLPNRLQRLRAASIAVAIITYQGSGIYLAAPQADPSSLLNPILVAINAMAAAIAYTAYKNPQWLQKRFTNTPPVTHT
jgi:hypothetical protein